MNWDTFFSSISQSAAALIAIIAAFIISKILGENEKLENLLDKSDKLFIQYNNLISRIEIRRFDWYDRQNIRYSGALEDYITRGDFDNLTDEEKLNKLFSIESGLFKTESCLQQLNMLIKKYSPLQQTLPDRMNTISFNIAQLDLVPNGLWDSLNEEKENIDQLKIESFTLIAKFNKTKRDIEISKNNLVPLKTTIYMLCASFLLTVVYPLHFLPLKENITPSLSFNIYNNFINLLSLKGLLLSLLCIAIVGIFGYFNIIIKRIQSEYNNINFEEKHFIITQYSKYFI